MRIFICAGEPSGDLHGANLVRTLRQRNPELECVGFGGERMQAAGCQLLFPLAQFAVMGFLRVLSSGPVFVNLLAKANRFFGRQRPDAVVLIDYPGFNWWMARRAHEHGIPVFYFVPPQLWAWASWRVRKMRRWVDHVLCTLPFEERWYRERGVPAQYIGHPYFDELPRQPLNQEFVSSQQVQPEKIIGLLPGSRTQEVEQNLETLVRSAQHVHALRPDTRFLVACFKTAHYHAVQEYLSGRNAPYIEPCVGRTPEIIHLAHACIAVSGSVGLELLYHGKPSVVIYRVRSYHLVLCRWFQKTRYISLVNLLADKELYPEYLTDHCQAEAIGNHVLGWLNDAAAYERVREELAVLRKRVAEPGACDRAAQQILDVLACLKEVGQRQAA
jgi:lipid-A-disaccharide synthase